MTTYVPESLLNEIEELKNLGKFDEAMRIVNSVLVDDPSNEDALLQVADIQYRKWEINKADKAIDFLNSRKDNKDPLWLYIKWILEMEKNNWKTAKEFLEKALIITNWENHEILRCYGLCEYRYWNREKWIDYLKDSFTINDKDAEVIYDLIEIYILEHEYNKAQKLIKHYQKNHSEIIVIDKTLDSYDEKIGLFEEFIKAQNLQNK